VTGGLALKLRVLRAERALTIEQAAERAGVMPDTISDAERGRRHPYLPTLRKLAAGYDVPVEELLEAEEPALAGKAEAPQSGPPAMHTTRGEELEEGFSPTLEHRYDEVFDRAVAELRREGLGDDVIAEKMIGHGERLRSSARGKVES
jgi:transcriptional regulator with XRE-family HTH domain